MRVAQGLLIAWDPGMRYLGLAAFIRSDLKSVYLPKAPRTMSQPETAALLAREAVRFKEAVCQHFYGNPSLRPQVTIYEAQDGRGGKQKGKQETYQKMRGVCDAASALLDAYIKDEVMPKDWKGTVPKKKMEERIISKLTDEELSIIHAAGLSTNSHVLDGIGIGKWAIARRGYKYGY